MGPHDRGTFQRWISVAMSKPNAQSNPRARP